MSLEHNLQILAFLRWKTTVIYLPALRQLRYHFVFLRKASKEKCVFQSFPARNEQEISHCAKPIRPFLVIHSSQNAFFVRLLFPGNRINSQGLKTQPDILLLMFSGRPHSTFLTLTERCSRMQPGGRITPLCVLVRDQKSAWL